jgi:hypothetical protein
MIEAMNHALSSLPIRSPRAASNQTQQRPTSSAKGTTAEENPGAIQSVSAQLDRKQCTSQRLDNAAAQHFINSPQPPQPPSM